MLYGWLPDCSYSRSTPMPTLRHCLRREYLQPKYPWPSAQLASAVWLPAALGKMNTVVLYVVLMLCLDCRSWTALAAQPW